mmetsp:Transcript_18576/g.22843  ORF Transcript_18576/g.22843 Transcript_18576/m.22843 type:complete len:303 (-) Transcript_18576:6-914(-)
MSGVSSEIKLIIGSLCTIIFEMFIGHILEIFKIQKQISGDSYKIIYKRLTKNKGIIGIWDGYFPWGFIMAMFKGASFTYGQVITYQLLSKYGSNYMDDIYLYVISASLGGAIQGIVMSPLLLLKTRVITSPKFREIKGGVYETTIESFKIGYFIIKNDGIMGLTVGMTLFSFKRFCDWLTRFLFVELLFKYISVLFNIEQNILRNNVLCITMIGLFGGVLSALSTSVLDVLTSLTQQHKSKKTASKKDDNNRNNKKFLRGLGLRILHVALTVVLMKDVVKYAIYLVEIYFYQTDSSQAKPDL